MKKMLLALLSFFCLALSAQNIKDNGEPYEVYCACTGDWIISGAVKPKHIIWGDQKEVVHLTTKEGKKIKFNNMVDVANYLSKRGWKVRDSETLSTHIFVVYVKTVRSDDEAKEGLYFDTDFKK